MLQKDGVGLWEAIFNDIGKKKYINVMDKIVEKKKIYRQWLSNYLFMYSYILIIYKIFYLRQFIFQPQMCHLFRVRHFMIYLHNGVKHIYFHLQHNQSNIYCIFIVALTYLFNLYLIICDNPKSSLRQNYHLKLCTVTHCQSQESISQLQL